MLELQIGDTLTFVSIRYYKYEFLKSDPADEENWIEVESQVRLDNFQGLANDYVTINEFIRFRDQLKDLYATLTGTAVFSTIEGGIYISVSGNGRGSLEVQCELQQMLRAKLECIFTLDQTYLLEPIRQLDLALKNRER